MFNRPGEMLDVFNSEREEQYRCPSENRDVFSTDMYKAAVSENQPTALAPCSQERPSSHSAGMKIAVQPLF